MVPHPEACCYRGCSHILANHCISDVSALGGRLLNHYEDLLANINHCIGRCYSSYIPRLYIPLWGGNVRAVWSAHIRPNAAYISAPGMLHGSVHRVALSALPQKNHTSKYRQRALNPGTLRL